MARTSDSPTATTTAATRPPESFATEPFAYASCKIDRDPTPEEEAAYLAHYHACPTPDDFWIKATGADWMLDLLAKLWRRLPVFPETELRTFALRCAEELGETGGSIAGKLLDVSRRYLSGSAAVDDLVDVRARTHRHVAQGGMQGLPRCNTYAAAMLAAWHAADPHAHIAATWTAEFAARHDAFVVLRERAGTWRWPEDRGEPWREDWRPAFFAKAHPQVVADAIADARRRQADLLRACLPKPFGVPTRGEVYFGQADASGRERVYCMSCGFQRGDVTPGVMFDARGLFCAACGNLVSRSVH
jgi:hypothetical protein